MDNTIKETFAITLICDKDNDPVRDTKVEHYFDIQKKYPGCTIIALYFAINPSMRFNFQHATLWPDGIVIDQVEHRGVTAHFVYYPLHAKFDYALTSAGGISSSAIQWPNVIKSPILRTELRKAYEHWLNAYISKHKWIINEYARDQINMMVLGANRAIEHHRDRINFLNNTISLSISDQDRVLTSIDGKS